MGHGWGITWTWICSISRVVWFTFIYVTSYYWLLCHGHYAAFNLPQRWEVGTQNHIIFYLWMCNVQRGKINMVASWFVFSVLLWTKQILPAVIQLTKERNELIMLYQYFVEFFIRLRITFLRNNVKRRSKG